MAKKGKNVVEQEINVKVAALGISQTTDRIKDFEKMLKQFGLTIKNAPGLYEFLGKMKAIEHQINDLAKNKNFKEVAKQISSLNNVMDSVESTFSSAKPTQKISKTYKLKNGEKRSVSRTTIESGDMAVLSNYGSMMSAGLSDQIQYNEKIIKQQNEKNSLLDLETRIKSEYYKEDKENVKIKEKEVKVNKENTKEIEKQNKEVKTMKKGIIALVADFFSLEKMVSRISFVLTAKFSYDIVKLFQRIPKQAMSSWIDFEDEISKVYALITDKSGVFKTQIEQSVIDISNAFGIAATKVSAAMYEIISAQVPVQYASRVLEQAAKLSQAGGTDLQSSARSLVQIANAYEISFDKIARISDVAFQTIKYGQLTMEQYTEEMQKVISTASIFRISQEEISAAIATMTINGVGANQAFTSLNQMLMQIANPTKQATDLMEQLGISLSIKDIQENGLGYALEALIPLLDSTDQHGRELISILFKSRTGFKAVASLLQNMGQYGDYYVHMLDSAGATSDALAERTQTVTIAMDKLKTSWNNVLIMAAQSSSKEVIGAIDGMRSVVEYLSKHTHILMLALKMVSAQIIAFATVALAKGIKSMNGFRETTNKAITSLFSFRQSLKILTSSVEADAAAISAAWASVTFGISIAIQLLVQFGHWIGQAAKKAEQARLDKLFNVREANKLLNESNRQLDEIASKISKLEGMKKMVSMYEQISKKQNKSNKEIERMDKLFSDVEKTMGKMGIQIDGTGTKLEKLAKYTARINQELNKYAQLNYFANVMKTIGEQQGSLSQHYGKHKISISSSFLRGALDKTTSKDIFSDIEFLQQQQFSNSVIGEYLGDIVIRKGNMYLKQSSDSMMKILGYARNKDITSLSGSTGSAINLISGQIKDIETFMSSVSVKKDLDKINNILQGLNAMLSNLYQIEGLGGQLELSNLNISDYDSINVGTEKKSEKSFHKQYEKLFESILGKDIKDSVEAISQIHQEALDDLNQELKEFDGIEKNKDRRKKVQEKINKLQEILFSSETITGFSTEMSRLSELYDIAIKSGDKGKAEGILGEIDTLYNVFKQGIGTVSQQIDTIKGLKDSNGVPMFTSQEIKHLDRYKSFAQDQLASAYFGGLSKTKMAHKYTKDNDNILNLTIDELEKLIIQMDDETLAEEQTILFEALSTLKEERLKFMETALRDELKTESDMGWFGILSNQLSQAVAEKKITNRKQFVAARDSFLSKHNLKLTKHQSREIDKIFPKFPWQETTGVKKYENESEIEVDMANRTVDTLQQVWSFYWDWEIRKLQEQQQKKLDILEAEKKMMLANTLMSNEQKAIIEERFQERQRQLQEKLDREMARKKKQQAMFDASIDFAKGLIGIWSYYLGKGRPVEAGLFSALLTAIFGTQMAMINNQKFAGGGLTGSGYGRPDETGHRPAGIVHAGELVIDKKTLDRNFNELTGLYSSLKSGKSFNNAVSQYMQGGFKGNLKPGLGSFAQGGLVGGLGLNSLKIDLGGIRTIDDVGLAKIVMNGNRKIRIING